ncbi:MAG: SLBB domain-containing protein [bacterium]
MSRKKFVFWVCFIFLIGFLWNRFGERVREIFSKKEAVPVKVAKRKQVKIISCYIEGEVERPGVYYLEEGSLVDDLVKEAGDFTKKADSEKINLSMVVQDRSTLKVPKKSFFKSIGIGQAPEKKYFMEPMEIVEEK